MLFCVCSPKIVAHLSAPESEKPAGPVASSQNSFVRFSFKEGGEKEVSQHISPVWNQFFIYFLNISDMSVIKFWSNLDIY